MLFTVVRLTASLALAALLQAQVRVPPGFGPRLGGRQGESQAERQRRAESVKQRSEQQQREEPGPTQPPPDPAAQPAPAQPEGAPAEPAEGEAPQRGGIQTTPSGILSLQNASLTEVIDALARQLRINYILDPRVKGSVTLNTYGEVKEIDTRSLLDMVLRINGAAMVKVGDIYRIVPLAQATRLPISPQVNASKEIPEDDQIMLNLIFLKYATVEELSKLLEPFIGEGAFTLAYPPANLLLLLDSRRNVRRTMELVALFDSDALASQRVRLFEVEHGRPSDITKELEAVLKAISLGEAASPIKFLPIDRLNLVVAVAPNPGAFETVETWVRKLDQPLKVTAGAIDNYVYRVKYGRAEVIAGAIMSLYLGIGYGGYGMMGGYGGGFGLFSGPASGFGNRYHGMGGLGGGYGGMGMMGGYGGMMGGYGGMGMMGGYGGGFGGGYGGMMGGYGGMGMMGGYGGGYAGATSSQFTRPGASGAVQGTAGATGGLAGSDLTGSYLGGGYGYGYGFPPGIPRVVPNPLDNTLLIQGTPQEYQQIQKLLLQLDVPPRQVLVDAKIYEVSLTGAFSAGVSTYLQRINAGRGRDGLGSVTPPSAEGLSGVNFSIGALVDSSRELFVALQTLETTTQAKVLSSPSLIATDSIPATITIGSEVPTLTAQAVSPIQAGGSSLFTNSIANRDAGITLAVLARVNPSGIVTLVIDQEVSAPTPNTASTIQSPSFSKRTIQTQVTVRDGDMIAIGGIINETSTATSAGFPGLHRIPILGALFGGKSSDNERTELVVFMTPRVIYDTNQILDATEEIKSRFKKLRKMLDQGE
ncbi:MAG: type II secretion system secretin GspD [Bryobacteraceae bacterium]|nr:type II secretion system secretin GspD [Bryobacteraceae bacterium]